MLDEKDRFVQVVSLKCLYYLLYHHQTRRVTNLQVICQQYRYIILHTVTVVACVSSQFLEYSAVNFNTIRMDGNKSQPPKALAQEKNLKSQNPALKLLYHISSLWVFIFHTPKPPKITTNFEAFSEELIWCSISCTSKKHYHQQMYIKISIAQTIFKKKTTVLMLWSQ